MMTDRFVIANGEREVGKSSILNALILWLALFRSHQQIALLSFSFKAAISQLDVIKKWHEQLPVWLQQNVLEWNRRGYAQFENGSRILAASIVSSTVRGWAFNVICLDELAAGNQACVRAFFDYIYPTVIHSSRIKVVIASTPNYGSKFDQMWEEANYPPDSQDPEKQWNGYTPILMKYA